MLFTVAKATRSSRTPDDSCALRAGDLAERTMDLRAIPPARPTDRAADLDVPLPLHRRRAELRANWDELRVHDLPQCSSGVCGGRRRGRRW